MPCGYNVPNASKKAQDGLAGQAARHLPLARDASPGKVTITAQITNATPITSPVSGISPNASPTATAIAGLIDCMTENAPEVVRRNVICSTAYGMKDAIREITNSNANSFHGPPGASAHVVSDFG